MDTIPAGQPHPATDFYGNLRPEPNEPNNIGRFDPGAIEFGSAPGTASFTVSPTTLAFGNQAIGTPSGPRTVTVTNTGNEALSGGAFTFGGGTPQPFSRATGVQGGGGSCGTTLAVGASCTFNVVFRPPTGTTNGTAFSRNLTVTFNGATGPATGTGTPVTLTGTGVTPGTLSFTSATGGTLTGALLTFSTAPGTATVTVTNTGAGSLQITAETFPINIGGRFSATGTTCSFTTPLAPTGTCTITIGVTGTTFDFGALAVANNGSGTVAGNSLLGLLAP
jgi:hypothetical protein